MGAIHGEKDNDRGAVCAGDPGSEYRGANGTDCARSACEGGSSEAVRAGVGCDAGSNISGGEQGLECSPGQACGAAGVRTGYSDSACAAGVHSEEMGKPSAGQQEIGDLSMNNVAAAVQQVIGVNGFKMKTLAATIQKGGQGKTFCVCHVAHAAADAGLRVLVLDLDSQGNASHTLGEYSCEIVASDFFQDTSRILDYFGSRDNSGITLVRKDDELLDVDKLELDDAVKQLRSHVQDLSACFDLCVFDTPPSLSNLMSSAIAASDYVISPVELEVYSFLGMELLVSVIHNLRQEYNPGLEFLGMIPNRYQAKIPRHQVNLGLIRENYGELVMPFEIRQRDSIAEALGEYCSPVWGKALRHKSAARVAAKEVRVMTDYVLKAMEFVK